MKTIVKNNVEDYIKSFPKEIQVLLNQMRETILKTAPLATESISYAMPTYKINGSPLIYFAGFKNHIGLYATPSGHKEFEIELAKYKQGKGSVQFPLDEPLPLKLISKIVMYRAKLIVANPENKI